jgi:hypothetical protein
MMREKQNNSTARLSEVTSLAATQPEATQQAAAAAEESQSQQGGQIKNEEGEEEIEVIEIDVEEIKQESVPTTKLVKEYWRYIDQSRAGIGTSTAGI